jgi:DNA primase
MASGGTSLTPDQLRLIKKYTNNLTILYDGDAAGVKAAMRGLDLALEEGLNVKLVLIPDKEDPDSYVNKVGASGFRDFIEKNKKDVVLFQLEVMLKDAGSDSVKKAAAVNTIAESISRINKAEDFTRRQDYIQRSSELLKIDEAGLHTLVNKLIRERIQKQDQKQVAEVIPTSEIPNETDDTLSLLNRDELHERALVRCLIEYGSLPWDEKSSIAEHILAEGEDFEMIENNDLRVMINQYKAWVQEGIEPAMKNFMFHEDPVISKTAVGLNDIRHEISIRWKEAPYEVKVPTRDELYREELHSVLTYLKLRKIKSMILENQRDMEHPEAGHDIMHLIKTHQHLKELEVKLTKELGTVILQ